MPARFVFPGAPAAALPALAEALAGPLGFAPEIGLELSAAEESETVVLPADFEFGLLARERLGAALAEFRRRSAEASYLHDDPDPAHSLVVEAFADMAGRALAAAGARPERLGVLLAAPGEGGADARAQAYRLMRLLWERLGAVRGEVGFLRHDKPFVRAALDRIASDPLVWVVIPMVWAPGERFDHLRLILDDHLRERPELAGGRLLAEPPGAHPALIHWLTSRALALWSARRRRDEGRQRSAKNRPLALARRLGDWDGGLVAETRDAAELRAALPEEIREAPVVFVKVTWHGYAAGTFTDAAALDCLLEALPGRAVVLEGYTSSRNSGGGPVADWETDARAHRAWLRAEDNLFLERTGLADVLRARGASYLNVTEAFWDEAAEDADPLGFVPEAVRAQAGAPLVSFARFKGPTRLAISNLFGLIPEPLRSRWHGPDISHFARVCCQVARAWQEHTRLYGVVEGLTAAVRWDRRGLYRSRWGAYDLLPAPGLSVVSRSLASADTLAARLQGQDPRRSAFFEAVRGELGASPSAESLALPADWLGRFG